MRALLEKDLRLIFLRKSTLFIYAVVGVVFALTFPGVYGGTYVTVLGTILAISTLGYDDSDNCMAFLFTLPCTRKQYALEKYLFVYSFSLVSVGIGIAIVTVVALWKGEPIDSVMPLEILIVGVLSLVLTAGTMIPLQVKFGLEKSRMALMVLIGVVIATVFPLSQIKGAEYVLEGVVSALNAANQTTLIAGLMGVLILFSAGSLWITMNLIEKKEY